MTENSPGYFTGRDPPPHQWVECSVRVPNIERGGETEVQCQAKVRCDDVIDALDLGRWSSIAFQHLWRAALAGNKKHELGLAVWYLKRASAGHHAEARATARLVRKLVEVADAPDAPDLRTVLLDFARDAEMAEFDAVELIHQSATQEH